MALHPTTPKARAEQDSVDEDDQKPPLQRVEGSRKQELDHEPPEEIDPTGNPDHGSEAPRYVVVARRDQAERPGRPAASWSKVMVFAPLAGAVYAGSNGLAEVGTGPVPREQGPRGRNETWRARIA